MTPTHILVPIEELSKLLSKHGTNWEGMALEFIDIVNTKSPKVDLSEEGIKVKAEKANNILTHGYILSPIQMYQQCAKDLLNTKP